MKRSGPIQRKTPMKQGTGLSRGKGMARPLPAGQYVRPKTAAKRRSNRDPAADGMPWADVRLIIFTRSLGRCEHPDCGRSLNIANMEGHHRRSQGVKGPHRNCPCNAVALCSTCHHVEVHGKPEVARPLGLILSKLAVTEPYETAARIYGHRSPVTLTCGGTYG